MSTKPLSIALLWFSRCALMATPKVRPEEKGQVGLGPFGPKMILLSLWSQEGRGGLQKPLEILAFGWSQEMDDFVKARSSLFFLLLWINVWPGGLVTGQRIIWCNAWRKYFGHFACDIFLALILFGTAYKGSAKYCYIHILLMMPRFKGQNIYRKRI